MDLRSESNLDHNRLNNVLLHHNKKGKKSFEGAQGILLDVDHGTYYCNSSDYLTSYGCYRVGIWPKEKSVIYWYTRETYHWDWRAD